MRIDCKCHENLVKLDMSVKMVGVLYSVGIFKSLSNQIYTVYLNSGKAKNKANGVQFQGCKILNE